MEKLNINFRSETPNKQGRKHAEGKKVSKTKALKEIRDKIGTETNEKQWNYESN